MISDQVGRVTVVLAADL